MENVLSEAGAQNTTFLGQVFMVTFLTSLGLEGVRRVVEEVTRPRLENDPQCGLTTGGREECWWDCAFQLYEEPNPGAFVDYITNIDCLADCYPPDHCLNSILADLRAAGGVCQDSWLDLLFPELFSTSALPCEFHVPDGFFFPTDIRAGLCSEQTKRLIEDHENCGAPLLGEKFAIARIVNDVVYSLCDFDTWVDFIKPPDPTVRARPEDLGGVRRRKEKRRRKSGKKKRKSGKRKKNRPRRKQEKEDSDRLTPLENVEVVMFSGFNVTLTSVPPLPPPLPLALLSQVCRSTVLSLLCRHPPGQTPRPHCPRHQRPLHLPLQVSGG